MLLQCGWKGLNFFETITPRKNFFTCYFNGILGSFLNNFFALITGLAFNFFNRGVRVDLSLVILIDLHCLTLREFFFFIRVRWRLRSRRDLLVLSMKLLLFCGCKSISFVVDADKLVLYVWVLLKKGVSDIPGYEKSRKAYKNEKTYKYEIFTKYELDVT